MHWSILFLFCAIVAISANPLKRSVKNTCGYDACPKGNKNELNVHIIPHSHDDVGWLKTVDQYYYGSKTNIQRAGVQYIIDSVVEALTNNPERRFIQVETAFFHMWWTKQTKAKQEQVRALINSGQLEIIGGAWSMNDEAAAHYHSIIDQFTLGLRVMNDTFGECGCPKIGWQIDPFGHSKEMASIFSQLGYDGLFFARLDYRDKSVRMDSKTSEMIWQGSNTLGSSTNLFTSVLFNHYSAPPGYCFDLLCSDDPMIEDEASVEYNLQKKVDGYADFIRGQAPNYPTDHILITMGDDFQFEDALHYYKNIDILLRGFTKFPQTYEDKKINVFYSTPSCYVKAVNEEATSKKQAFPLKTDDFFPYASDANSYWTGYFTSRPTSKRMERQGNNILQVSKQLTSYDKSEGDYPELFSLKSAMGFMQHHDAITGTEKQHVVDDYSRIMSKAMEANFATVNTMISKLLQKSDAKIDYEFKHCLLSNVSICQQSLEDQFLVAVYNPLSKPVDKHVRLPVDATTFAISDPSNEAVTYQISEAIDSFDYIEGQHGKYDLVFLAKAIPALGFKLFIVEKHESKEYGNELRADTNKSQYNLGDDETGCTIDEKTGMLSSVTIRGIKKNIQQELMYYIGADNRASGAYIFRPSPAAPDAISITTKAETITYKGDLYDEVHQTFNDYAKQIIRVYKKLNYIEFDWLVGPINISDDKPKEIIARFKTDMKTDGVFYTDSNGREMIQRKLNFRETYNYTNEEPVSGNYYPVDTKIMIADTEYQLSVMNDRAQGGSSLRDGELELMVHRRLLKDDGFGVGEALNESQFGKGLVARGTHYLTFGKIGTDDVEVEKEIAQADIFSPFVMVSNKAWDQAEINLEFSGLTEAVPDNVQILSLEPINPQANTLLLRLEHIYEANEHPTLSDVATLNVENLFTKFKIKDIKETTLGSNQWLEDNERLSWTTGEKLATADYRKAPYSGPTKTYNTKLIPQKNKDFDISLKPMQIRTFIITVEKL